MNKMPQKEIKEKINDLTKIFITGGTGFIGKYLVKKLQKRGYSLLLLSQQPLKNINFVEGDLAKMENWKNKVKEFKPDITIHLAWEALPDYSIRPSLNNLKYGLDLFNFLAEIGCKTVLSTGSCWEYGEQSGKLSEDMALKSFNAYTAAKNSLHWLGAEIAKENNMKFIWTRIFYVYGHGQRKESLIPYLIDCAKSGKIPKIKTLSAKNDFVHVEDVAEAISLLLENCKESGTYNIGSGKLTSIKEIIEIIAKKFNLQKQYKNIISQPIDVLTTGFYADISKIKKEINWEPKNILDKGVF